MLRSARILLFAFAIFAAPLHAEISDTAVKAAFLPRFAHYVTWPITATPKGNDPFVLCVIGDDPFGSELDDAARSQSIDGRKIIVRRLSSASGAAGCQIAFVDGSDEHPASQVLAALAHAPVLTVTNPGAEGSRGIIQFAVVGGRVRFVIDQRAAGQRGLSISSRLLALAIGVKQ
ncbi:MAG TPA: YfiR family protein [Sphingomicrobium sp.]|nr:YfiR family protein [Sphingomicrobium sp.]